MEKEKRGEEIEEGDIKGGKLFGFFWAPTLNLLCGYYVARAVTEAWGTSAV